MEVRVEISELVRQIIAIRNYIERFLAKAFLHLDHIFAQTVFSRQLIAHGKVVNFLILVHLIVDVGLHTLAGPLDVPLIALCLVHAIRLEHSLHEFSIRLHHLEEHVELRLFILTWLREA